MRLTPGRKFLPPPSTVVMARPYTASQIPPKLKKPWSRGPANPTDF
jgi:hypothetical protein